MAISDVPLYSTGIRWLQNGSLTTPSESDGIINILGASQIQTIADSGPFFIQGEKSGQNIWLIEIYSVSLHHKNKANMDEKIIGTIDVRIDDFTPCLRNEMTGDIVDTEVIRIHRKSFLSKFTERTGWYTDWSKLVDDSEIYGLVVKGTADIQGLVALQRDYEAQAIYIVWMCVAPFNNKLKTVEPRYSGVGGHLFAIAGNISLQAGFDGYVFGNASNADVLQHYIDKLGAVYLGIMHPYQFAIEADNMQKILETYTYDQTNNENF